MTSSQDIVHFCSVIASPADILRNVWGYSAFRPNQEAIVHSLLQGEDTLALLPTGGGKSLCFQVPALCLPGICIVVSPLVALMDDQVQQLVRRGVKAVAINGAQSFREIDRILDNCVYGDVKFLYVSPERLQNELFLTRMKKMNVSFIAVDEAHCISQWGYDFRPAYLQIAEIRVHKPQVPVLALTASATPEVVADIQKQLHFRQPKVIAGGFARENLGYHVVKEDDKEGRIVGICRKMLGSGIVYCGTRLRTKEMARMLQQAGISATFYHAGMSHAERREAFQRWLTNDVRVMCATNAFGMGIDKPDVRFVLHADVPQNMESYFQEAGRGGRDQLSAHAVLLWREHDLEKLDQHIAQKYPDMAAVRAAYQAVGDYLQLAIGAGKDTVHTLALAEVCKRAQLNYATFYQCIQLLQLAGYLTLDESTWMPSRLYFPVSSKDLYSFQVANSAMDQFVKTVLRLYGGLFEHFVPIQEKDIAKALQLSEQEVIKKLRLLEQNGMVQYEGRSLEPRISFLSGRINSAYLLLPDSVYTQRKEADTQRAAAIKQYLQTPVCRSQQLLAYFGEKQAETCGRCDVCRATNQQQSGSNSLALEAQMEKHLSKRPLTIEALLELLPYSQRQSALELLRFQLDEGNWGMNDEQEVVVK